MTVDSCAHSDDKSTLTLRRPLPSPECSDAHVLI